MVDYCAGLTFLRIVLLISIKHDFLKIEKISTQQEKPVFYNHKN